LRYRVWQVFFGRKRRTDPCVSEIRHPVRSDFHPVVTKTGLSVTFKPTNSTYSYVTDNPVIARLGPARSWESNTGGAILKTTTLMK
jgi:hypothetical protein